MDQITTQRHLYTNKIVCMKCVYLSSIFFFLFCHICQGQIPAEWSGKYSNHVILLIDRSGSMTKANGATELRNIFYQQLENICFKDGAIIPERKLLDRTKGDYLSIATFHLNEGANITTEFIRAPERYKQNYSDEIFDRFWDENIEQNFSSYFSGNYSGITYSRYIAMSIMKNSLEDRFVNRTFLVYVTDGEFNSAKKDPLDEERNLKGAPASIKGFAEANKIYNDIRDNFDNQEIRVFKGGNRIKVMVEEIVPRMKNFSIKKILDEPPPTNQILHLTRKGFLLDYPVKVDPDDIDALKHFKIDSMAYSLINKKNGDIIPGNYIKGGTAKIYLPQTYPHLDRDTLYLNMRFWLRFNDGLYNMHQITPFGTDEQGRSGLNVSIPVTFEPLRFPLSWGPMGRIMYNISAFIVGPSQSANASFWIILAVLMLLAIIFGYIWMKGTQTDTGGTFTLK